MKHKKITKLVFSGGGINGLCFLGCIKALEEHHILPDIDYFLGTSAGSMMALLLNVGYSSSELIEIINNINMDLIKDITSDNVFSYFTHFGIDSGNKFIKVFEILIKNKGIASCVTFQELYNLTHKHLIITGTNLSYKRADFFDYKEFPDMEVLQALRISMSIPFIFTKPIFNDCIYVDGSIMANYPIYYFNSTHNILGFLITEERTFQEIKSIDTFTMSLINSLMKKDSDMMEYLYKDITVFLKKKSNLLNFNLSHEEKNELYEFGYENTLQYLNKYYQHFKQPDPILSEIRKYDKTKLNKK